MPTDLIRKRLSTNIIFNRAILDKPVGLGKTSKKTDRDAAAPAAKAPDEDEQKAKAHPAQIPAIVTQCPKRLRAVTVRTLCWGSNSFVETFGDISLWINIDGVDQLHDQLRLPLRLWEPFLLTAGILRRSVLVGFIQIFKKVILRKGLV